MRDREASKNERRERDPAVRPLIDEEACLGAGRQGGLDLLRRSRSTRRICSAAADRQAQLAPGRSKGRLSLPTRPIDTSSLLPRPIEG